MLKMTSIYLVAGMHRSGTSLLANWLYDSGVYLGDEFLKADNTNKKGHFEDTGFLEHHKRLLLKNNLNRSGLILDRPIPVLDKTCKKYFNTFVSKNNNIKYSTLAWKEPRSTLFMRQYKEHYPNLKSIAIYRDPTEVVNSLLVRLIDKRWYKYLLSINSKNEWGLNFYDFYFKFTVSKWVSIFLDSYIKYNNEIIEFKSRYPEDILIFSHQSMVSESKSIKPLIDQILNIKMTSFESVFDKELLSPVKYKHKICDNKLYAKANKIYDELSLIEKQDRNAKSHQK